MLRSTALAFASAWALFAPGEGLAAPQDVRVSIEAGSLVSGLQDLARQSGIDLLFDPDLVARHQSPAVRGTVEGALHQLLSQTDLVVRRTESGAWLIERPEAAPLERQDADVPEILIVGRHTQNSDIRRFESDVQPYRVTTRKALTRSSRANVEEYFATRITENAQFAPLAGSASGDARSSIDLRGVGLFDTLLLVDGRRMPTLPDLVGFYQPDVNSIPVHAIERIETLTGTAGGIFGFGAQGGVVNIVLDRESQGLDTHLTQGVSSRGDAAHQAIEARYGHRSEDGATSFSFFLAHSEAGHVRVRNRDFATNDREAGARFLSPARFVSNYQNGNSVAVVSASGPLAFKPEFGGGQLGADVTYLPFGFSGDNVELATALTRHAGQVDSSVPADDLNGDLGANPQVDSALFDLRHSFDGRFDVYLDAVALRSRANTAGHGVTGQALMLTASPANPFNNTISVYFPITGIRGLSRQSLAETTRFTAGVAADLFSDWRGSLDASAGGFLRDSRSITDTPGLGSFLFFSGSASDPIANPLGDWSAFQASVPGDVATVTRSSRAKTRFRDMSLRLAGPVFRASSGRSTLTLVAEDRSEYVPAYHEIQTTVVDGMTTSAPTRFIASQANQTTSVYAELKSSVFEDAAPVTLLRGLEFQLAVRRDDQVQEFSADLLDPQSRRMRRSFIGTAYTAGLKTKPRPWLMLRGSFSTGDVPPRLSSLSNVSEAALPALLIPDPKRPGDTVDVSSIDYLAGANPDLALIHANTLFLGFMLTPSEEDGPRLVIDYSRIRRTNDIMAYFITDILAHEDFWPTRVTRAPLSDADRATGLTFGRITGVDARFKNDVASQMKSVDVRAEWPLDAFRGRMRISANATRYLSHVRSAPFQPDQDYTNSINGPLKWRANGGLDWAKGGVTLGANVQHLGSYRVTSPELSDAVNARFVAMQGSREVPAQTYLDLHASWRILALALRPAKEITLELGIINALDKAPPRQIPGLSFISQGYSPYGDPRQRRFELTLSTHF